MIELERSDFKDTIGDIVDRHGQKPFTLQGAIDILDVMGERQLEIPIGDRLVRVQVIDPQ